MKHRKTKIDCNQTCELANRDVAIYVTKFKQKCIKDFIQIQDTWNDSCKWGLEHG